MDTTTTSMADLAKEICQHLEYCTNEVETKRNAIDRAVSAWGWDGPGQVRNEVPFKLHGRAPSPTKCDYVFIVGGEHAVLIEAKARGKDLGGEYYTQLYHYFAQSDAKLAILTDGQRWRFYSDLDEVNKMDRDPFRVIDMCGLREGDEEFLHAFRREGFDATAIRARAEGARESERLRERLHGWMDEALANPSSDLVRLAMKESGYDGRRGQAEIESWRAGIRSAFADVKGVTLAIDEERASATGSEYHPPHRPDTPPPVPKPDDGKPAGRAKATKPDGFRLWGRNYPAKNWKDVWHGVAEALYDRHPDRFRDVVGKPRGKRSYVEVDRQMLNSAYRVRDSQYWVGGGANGEALRERCHNLLELLGYARSDIEFFYVPPAE